MCTEYYDRYLRCGCVDAHGLVECASRKRTGPCPRGVTQVYNDIHGYCPAHQHQGDPKL
ncbi:hypothetical protein GE09DRAFT_1209408 [Coniochaeta sp. 2T2.1]|nr:hypothetical protein GE09DRAFT_1209408 [Coniochaeta sp. 2T2.1]